MANPLVANPVITGDPWMVRLERSKIAFRLDGADKTRRVRCASAGEL
jgi:hypothetical protein